MITTLTHPNGSFWKEVLSEYVKQENINRQSIYKNEKIARLFALASYKQKPCDTKMIVTKEERLRFDIDKLETGDFLDTIVKTYRSIGIDTYFHTIRDLFVRVHRGKSSFGLVPHKEYSRNEERKTPRDFPVDDKHFSVQSFLGVSMISPSRTIATHIFERIQGIRGKTIFPGDKELCCFEFSSGNSKMYWDEEYEESIEEPVQQVPLDTSSEMPEQSLQASPLPLRQLQKGFCPIVSPPISTNSGRVNPVMNCLQEQRGIMQVAANWLDQREQAFSEERVLTAQETPACPLATQISPLFSSGNFLNIFRTPIVEGRPDSFSSEASMQVQGLTNSFNSSVEEEEDLLKEVDNVVRQAIEEDRAGGRLI